jgi:hypothetical protein
MTKYRISLWFATLLLACGGSREPADGPAERAGENVDEAADEAREEVEDAADEAGDAIDDAGDEVEPGATDPQ